MRFENLFKRKTESEGGNLEAIEKGVFSFIERRQAELEKIVEGLPKEDQKLYELFNGRGSIQELFPQGF